MSRFPKFAISNSTCTGYSTQHATELRNEGGMRMETRTGAAQKEGGVHDMHSYKKVLW
jgi:IMP dehydrogenase